MGILFYDSESYINIVVLKQLHYKLQVISYSTEKHIKLNRYDVNLYLFACVTVGTALQYHNKETGTIKI